jgi:predicted ester cyclase
MSSLRPDAVNTGEIIDGVGVDPTAPDMMAGLVGKLAAAKSRQDTAAALALMHEDMVLDSPAFGTRVHGLTDNRAVLDRLFRTFPDYRVSMEGAAPSPIAYACWGRVRMTMRGERFGVSSNGRPAVLPAFFLFGFRDGLITYERMMIDLASLCSQSGVSTDAVRQKLFA